jgi:nuclear transcription Y subunit beta
MDLNGFKSDFLQNDFIKGDFKNKPFDGNSDNKRIPSISFLRGSDRQLPLAVVSKIMKKPVPSAAKLSKDSKELMQKCSSEFIAIVTCRAKEMSNSEARKTITGEDLIRAMEDLDMPYYAEYSRKIFEKYKDSLKITRSYGDENLDFMNH